jgi:cation:H+ antiporter
MLTQVIGPTVGVGTTTWRWSNLRRVTCRALDLDAGRRVVSSAFFSSGDSSELVFSVTGEFGARRVAFDLERREAWSAQCLFERETGVALASVAFVVGALVSLATSWVLVTRLERVGERLGLSEALLGVVAALGADAPEITSSISALVQHQRAIGAGVVVGSNVFNLAALLGLGAVVSGFIALHRKVVVLGGFVATWTALCCLATVTGVIATPLALALAGVVLVMYLVVLGVRRTQLGRFPLPSTWSAWLSSAVDEEEMELVVAIRPPRGRARDAAVAFVSLLVVVLSSVAMERGASYLGHRWHVADAVIGGVVLAAVTSLPNAVAALYLAARQRGSAALSTALNSNNLNVIAGLLIPGAFVGLAAPSAPGTLTAASFALLTLAVLALAFARRGLSRRAGLIVIAGYILFVVWLVAIT